MLRILFVDDEPFILQGLSVLIDWEKEGFEIAGTAANGLEAIRFLKNNEVDLILADIRMPAMSGLELLEKLRTEGISDAYFIILSGYSDFEYARKALQYGCMDYIRAAQNRGRKKEAAEASVPILSGLSGRRRLALHFRCIQQ